MLKSISFSLVINCDVCGVEFDYDLVFVSYCKKKLSSTYKDKEKILNSRPLTSFLRN